jgi:hypothetical protein
MFLLKPLGLLPPGFAFSIDVFSECTRFAHGEYSIPFERTLNSSNGVIG